MYLSAFVKGPLLIKVNRADLRLKCESSNLTNIFQYMVQRLVDPALDTVFTRSRTTTKLIDVKLFDISVHSSE